MKIQYEVLSPRGKTVKLICQANEIIDEFAAKGFVLTVRQIYYQFVARDLVPNTVQSYGLIQRTLDTGRMGGWIDWHAIEDRSRRVNKNSHWSSPQSILESAAAGYQLDSRRDQPWLLEVWIEKEALLGIIEPVCEELDITYLACKGYYSLSAMWRGAQRFLDRPDQKGVVIHLGDHDPSGLDMTRDIRDRLHTFGCTNIKINRIALTMEQVEQYNPPPNFAKLSDSRAPDYIEEFGSNSWELDALSPEIVTQLITEEVAKYTDQPKRDAILEQEQEQREQLERVAEGWNDLIEGGWF